MLALVDHLQKSGKAVYLFGFTSMFDLIISQTPPTHPDMPPYLLISPMPDGTLRFRYVDTGVAEDQWHRTVPGPDGIRRLEGFFEQLRWFGGEAKQ
jgi:hypothetical protein